MRLECACGRTYRAADPDCPGCGATLTPRPDDAPRRAAPPGYAKIAPEVLVRQKLALRDELRIRDRQLRQTERRLQALQGELDRLRGPAVRVVDAPLSLPSDRPDLALIPPSDEAPALLNAIPLPDDRIPIFEERTP